MTDKAKTPIEQMAALAGEMTEAAIAGQAVGLQILMAEMQALAQVMPGADLHHHTPTQAEVEADFDNMPV